SHAPRFLEQPAVSRVRASYLQGENVSMNGSSLRIHVLALFVLSSLGLAGRPATAQSGSDDAESIAVAPSSIRIYNFGRINPNYYRGAQPTGHDYPDLAALGVKTLIDLTGDDGQANEKTMAETAGMSYVHIPMTTHAPPSTDSLARFLAIVN